MGKSAPPSSPTLRKVGADLRWLIEKAGVNPEKALVTIGVPDVASQQLLLNTCKREFDPAVMRVIASNIFCLHGVFVCITVVPAVSTITTSGSTTQKPLEPS